MLSQMEQVLEKLQSSTVKEYLLDQKIEYLALFGSASLGEDRPDSDVDLLVRFGRPIGLFGQAGVQLDLEKMIGRPVDLVTEGAMSARIRPYIEPDLKVVYVKQDMLEKSLASEYET